MHLDKSYVHVSQKGGGHRRDARQIGLSRLHCHVEGAALTDVEMLLLGERVVGGLKARVRGADGLDAALLAAVNSRRS